MSVFEVASWSPAVRQLRAEEGLRAPLARLRFPDLHRLVVIAADDSCHPAASWRRY